MRQDTTVTWTAHIMESPGNIGTKHKHFLCPIKIHIAAGPLVAIHSGVRGTASVGWGDSGKVLVAFEYWGFSWEAGMACSQPVGGGADGVLLSALRVHRSEDRP